MLSHSYSIGRFDRKVQIIHKVVSINDFNGESEEWEVLKDKWAMEVPLSAGAKAGNETILAEKTTAVRRTTIVVRYDNAIDEEMRVVMDDKVYGIISVRDSQASRRRFTELELEFLEGEVFNEPEGAFTSGFTNGFNV